MKELFPCFINYDRLANLLTCGLIVSYTYKKKINIDEALPECNRIPIGRNNAFVVFV